MMPTVNPTPNITPTTVNNPYDLLTPGGQLAQTTTVNAPGGKVELGETGRSGTFIFGGIITQEEYNKDLQRWEALAIWDQMRRGDASVKASLLAMTLPILGAIWSIQPASDEEQDIIVADHIRRELFGRNVVFSDFLREALLMLPFGYSVFEKVLQWTTFTYTPPAIPSEVQKLDAEGVPLVDDNGKPVMEDPTQPPSKTMKLIGLAKLGSRKQRSIFKWAIADDQPGITQIMPGKNYEIPMEKLIVFTHEKEGDNFEGMSALRAAYQHWYFKKNLYLIDGIKNEKQALGVPYVKPTAGADQGAVNDAIAAAQNMRANEAAYVKIPEGWDIGFMDMGVKGVVDLWPSIEHHDRQIMKAVLAQFLDLGKSGSGSMALSEDHSDIFEKSLEAVAKNIAATIQNQLIKPLVDINFPGVENYPTIEHTKIGDDDLGVIGEFVNKVMAVGAMTPDPSFEQHLRTLMHAPDLPDDIAEDYQNRELPKKAVAAMTMMPEQVTADANAATAKADGIKNDNSSGPADDTDDAGDGNSNLTASAYARAIKARDELQKAIEREYTH